MKSVVCNREPDLWAITILTFIWIATDVLVIAVEKDDDIMFEYLTNQVWLLSLPLKLLLLFFLGMWSNSHGIFELYSTWHVFTATYFVSLGVCQAGVLGGFFTLVLIDPSLLSNMLDQQEATIGEIIAWNHLRHVTTVFLHLAIAWSLRHYLKQNARSSLSRIIFYAVPPIIGLVHHAVFDDQKLYKYGSSEVGTGCSVAYGAFSVLAAFYFDKVVIGASAFEQRNTDAILGLYTSKDSNDVTKS